jgi:hypothetical protein
LVADLIIEARREYQNGVVKFVIVVLMRRICISASIVRIIHVKIYQNLKILI